MIHAFLDDMDITRYEQTTLLQRDRLGRHVLFYAVFGDQSKNIYKILEHVALEGKKLDDYVTHRDAFGHDIIFYAAERRRVQTLQLLSIKFPHLLAHACADPHILNEVL